MTALVNDEPYLDMLQLPLAYGCLRVRRDAPDEICRLEQQLRSFAAARGLYFVTFFFDFWCGTNEGFCELMTELQWADCITDRDKAAAEVLTLDETHNVVQ